jgi:hypothetical protein
MKAMRTVIAIYRERRHERGIEMRPLGVAPCSCGVVPRRQKAPLTLLLFLSSDDWSLVVGDALVGGGGGRRSEAVGRAQRRTAVLERRWLGSSNRAANGTVGLKCSSPAIGEWLQQQATGFCARGVVLTEAGRGMENCDSTARSFRVRSKLPTGLGGC